VSSIIIRCCIATAFVALVASPARSQAPTESADILALLSGPRASTTVIVGPSETLGTVTTPSSYEEVTSAVRRRRFSRAETMMIVGGAALVTGIVVGDDAGTVLILAGAGIGGYGLYLHLNNPTTRLQR
jgi:hypothetical protein